MKQQRCESCYFWRRYPEGTAAGLCRRFPPVFDTNNAARHPVLNEWEWCGEFREAPNDTGDGFCHECGCPFEPHARSQNWRRFCCHDCRTKVDWRRKTEGRKTIEWHRIGVRLRKVFKFRLPCETYGDIMKLKASQLIEQRNCGVATLNELCEHLREKGLSLTDEGWA